MYLIEVVISLLCVMDQPLILWKLLFLCGFVLLRMTDKIKDHDFFFLLSPGILAFSKI